MQDCDIVFERAKLADGNVVSLGVRSGNIAVISAEGPPLAGKLRIDLEERLVVPGLVDGHIHLDKSFIGELWKPHRPCTNGFNVRERVSFEKELLAGARPVERRAAALADLAISRGTLYMRSHVDVDADLGLRNVEAILSVREQYRDLISIELVAFPQSGILASPGTADLLSEAIKTGVELVGGLDPAGFDRSIEDHLNVVFGIADRHGVGIDIHLHDPGALGIFELEDIANWTQALGLVGKVAVSHAYALGEVGLDIAKRTADTLAEAGVAIMTNAPGDRAFPPVAVLREAGVRVFAGNDNIRDLWWPYGDGDMLERAMIIGYRSGFYTDEDLGFAFDMAATQAAQVLGIPNYGLCIGAPASFVAMEAQHVQEAVVARPPRRSVYCCGKLVGKDGVFTGTPGTISCD